MTEEPSAGGTEANPPDSAGIQADGIESPSADKAAATARPYGPVASIALTFLLLTVLGGIEGVVEVALKAGWSAAGPGEGHPVKAPSDGLLISVPTLVGAPAVVALVALLALARRYPLRDYLALRLPTARQAALAVGGLIFFMAASYLTSYALGRPLEPTMVVEAYRTGAHFLIFVAFVVAAPVGEEVVFRGFLYHGIGSSSWGPVIAIPVSAVFWGALHFPFGVYGVVTISLLGLYLGAARLRTGSLPLMILLHGLNNAVGLAVVAFLAQRAT